MCARPTRSHVGECERTPRYIWREQESRTAQTAGGMWWLLVCAVCVGVADAGEHTYAEVPDTINLHSMLRNDRVVSSYEKCLTDEGPCTKHGETLKQYLPDALATGCSKCTPKQKVFAEEAIRILRTEHKDVWARLCTKYDPDGHLTKQYADKLEAAEQGKSTP